jgi:hypothetical protein
MIAMLFPQWLVDRVNRFWVLLGALAIGYAMAFMAPFLGPIHELGHLLEAWSRGREARIVAWNHIEIEYLSVLGMHSGFAAELLVLAIALGFMIATRRTSLALFFGGWYYGTADFAFTSTDFDTILARYPDYEFDMFVLFTVVLFIVTVVTGRLLRKRN